MQQGWTKIVEMTPDKQTVWEYDSAKMNGNEGKRIEVPVFQRVDKGLGTVNENLPGFVVMLDPTGGPISGAKNWSSGCMPATYQATVLNQMGLDPDKVACFYGGLDQRLVGVEGAEVMRKIVA